MISIVTWKLGILYGKVESLKGNTRLEYQYSSLIWSPVIIAYGQRIICAEGEENEIIVKLILDTVST